MPRLNPLRHYSFRLNSSYSNNISKFSMRKVEQKASFFWFSFCSIGIGTLLINLPSNTSLDKKRSNIAKCEAETQSSNSDKEKSLVEKTQALKGKVAIVTGGGGGIGAATAVALAAAGAKVAILDINPNSAFLLANEINNRFGPDTARGYEIDVRNVEGLARILSRVREQWGKVHIAIANAGIVRSGNILTMSEEDYNTVLDVNVKGVFYTVQSAAREMLLSDVKNGKIIVVSSANAVLPHKHASAYCGSKAALSMMVRCWAQDLIPHGISINCIGPGAIDTPLIRAQLKDENDLKELNQQIPMGRLGTAEEVANFINYLVTEPAYLTGSFILFDGGIVDSRETDLAPRLELKSLHETHSGDQVLMKIDQEAKGISKAEQQARDNFGLR